MNSKLNDSWVPSHYS